MLEISGHILFSRPTRLDSKSIVRLRVFSDARMAGDRAPATLAELLITPQGQDYARLPYSIICNDLDEAGSAYLHVHIDMASNGDVEEGDHLTTQFYPLDVTTGSLQMDIQVTRV